MAKGQCCNCKVELTKDNTGPLVLEKGFGYCKSCNAKLSAKWAKKNPEKARIFSKMNYDKHAESRLEYDKIYRNKNKEWIKIRSAKLSRTLNSKHIRVKILLRKEGVSETDFLFRPNFYFELIKNNECHYCLGALTETGHNLDRIDNLLNHICSNVVPCCGGCNQIKGARLLYEEMMLLAPVLREIRLRRERTKEVLSGNNADHYPDPSQ